MNQPTRSLPMAEFIALVAALTSVIALGTDLMLASLGPIGRELGASSANAAQLIIPIYLLGTAFGQIFAGTASDYLGRKPVILAGLGVFGAGSLICLFSQSFEVMLLGRFIQGMGTAAPRAVTQAMVRDLFEGARMARIMSFVMGVFLLVPALAPSLGQLVSDHLGWRAIFTLFLVQAACIGIWFILRQPETHPLERRPKFSWPQLNASFWEAMLHPIVLRFTLAAGALFGAFFTFIGSFPQIFDEVFDIQERFPLYFAILSASLAAAAIVNARYVGRVGMHGMVLRSVIGCVVVSAVYLAGMVLSGVSDALLPFMIWAGLYCFFQGVVIGNLISIVLEPMPHNAGMASTVFSTLSTIIATAIAIPLGLAFNGTVYPLTLGFLVCSALALILVMKPREK